MHLWCKCKMAGVVDSHVCVRVYYASPMCILYMISLNSMYVHELTVTTTWSFVVNMQASQRSGAPKFVALSFNAGPQKNKPCRLM